MSGETEERLLADEAATDGFGAELAGRLRPGDVVVLKGDLGAGKSSLARAVIRTLLGDPRHEVPSPTFSLVQPYRAPSGPILHADLYRLGSAAEADELGLLDDPDAIVLVEWADRAPWLAGRADLVVSLAVPPGGVGRHVRVRGRRWAG